MSSDGDALIGLAALCIGLAILAVVGAVIALIWYIAVAIEMELRYQRYRGQAGQHFDEVRYRMGFTDDVDAVLEAMFPGIAFENGQYGSLWEWAEGILFADEFYDESA